MHSTRQGVNSEHLQVLLDAGADVRHQTAEGRGIIETVLWSHGAAARKSKIMGLLLRNGANVNDPVKEFDNLMTLALLVMSDNASILIATLIQHGHPVHANGEDDDLDPLHVAALHNDVRSIKVLIEAGDDMNRKTKGGDDALMVAKNSESGGLEAFEYLRGVKMALDEQQALSRLLARGSLDDGREKSDNSLAPQIKKKAYRSGRI